VAQVAEALGVSTKTIESIKQRTLEGGLKAALEIRKRVTPPIEARFDGAFAARLTTLACSPAPEGFARWTVRLLAQKVVELGIAREVSTMTIQRTLKKTRCSLTSANTGKSLLKKTPPS
jgi:transposase